VQHSALAVAAGGQPRWRCWCSCSTGWSCSAGMDASCVVIESPWEQQQQLGQHQAALEAMSGAGQLRRRQQESPGECWVQLAGCYSCLQQLRDIQAVIWHAISIKGKPQPQPLHRTALYSTPQLHRLRAAIAPSVLLMTYQLATKA
jgi:hypothetical protein